MKVTHKSLGIGTVIRSDDNNVTVDFNGEEKIMVIKFARLSNEDGTPFGTQFVAKAKKVKLNKANFMSDAEFAKTKYGQMSDSEWEEDVRLTRIMNLPSSLR